VIAGKLSEAALRGARGNSGAILSQILRGFSSGLEGKETFIASDFAAALQTASRAAYKAVMKPVEGTILTVVREAADAAQASASRGNDLSTVIEDTVFAARASVTRTPELLAKLKEAGVVDAGGQGLTYVLEGIWRYTRGEAVELTAQEQVSEQEAAKGAVEIEEEFGYEVVFLVAGDDLDIEKISASINEMGGVSTVVAGDEKLVKVHTHTPTPGQILDYGVSLGSLQDINIENLQLQSLQYAAESKAQRGAEALAGNGAAPPAAVGGHVAGSTEMEQLRSVGTVAVVAGDGMIEIYQSLGVSYIVAGGQTMNPSTEELLAGVEACPSERVILLPNNNNVILSAQQVAQISKKQVHIVPTDSMPQGITALLAFNFEEPYETNCQAMDNAIKRVDTAEFTQAVRTVQVEGISVTEGDIIGLVNGRLMTAGTDMLWVVHDTLGRMRMDQHELVTIYAGESVTREAADKLAQAIKGWYPSVEIESHHGGQPFYAYLISAE
jgi:fatty acid kinase